MLKQRETITIHILNVKRVMASHKYNKLKNKCNQGGAELIRLCPPTAKGCFTNDKFPLPPTRPPLSAVDMSSIFIAFSRLVSESHLVLTAMFSTSLTCNFKVFYVSFFD